MMKTYYLIFFLILVISGSSCSNSSNKKSAKEKDESSVTSPADTGFNGITKYQSQGRLVKEVTFKNGIRDGLMKTYYASGKLHQTFWYVNGKIQDTAVMYNEDGTIFRKSPFRDDSINGIQTQYYKSGKVRARLEFVNGLRTPFLEEFESSGKKVTGYSDIDIKIKDEYKQKGTYIIILGLSKKNIEADFYVGGLVNGLFNPKKCKKVNDSKSSGVITFQSSSQPGKKTIEIITAELTNFGNRNLVIKKIDLPYNDLKQIDR
jgi:antitoxin component YwqK of YwqJK toxin-antitoxin module